MHYIFVIAINEQWSPKDVDISSVKYFASLFGHQMALSIWINKWKRMNRIVLYRIVDWKVWNFRFRSSMELYHQRLDTFNGAEHYLPLQIEKYTEIGK